MSREVDQESEEQEQEGEDIEEDEEGDEEERRTYLDEEAEEGEEGDELDDEERLSEQEDAASQENMLHTRSSRPRVPDFDGPSSGATGIQPTQDDPGTQANLNEIASVSTPEAVDADLRSVVDREESALGSDSEGDHDDNNDGDSDPGSDGEYLDEAAKKVREDARVARMIAEAEARAALPSDESARRASQLLKGGRGKDATIDLIQTVETSVDAIGDLARKFGSVGTASVSRDGPAPAMQAEESAEAAEAKLALTVSKEDFARMRVVGQFNLGFIIALRPAAGPSSSSSAAADDDPPTGTDAAPSRHDELFIIDQHASDEKFNFERLARATVLRHQRLVVPRPLELGAVELEVAAAHRDALLKNGFVVDVADDDDEAVDDDDDDDEKYAQAVSMGAEGLGAPGAAGRRRATLLALPTSREATFSPRDLDELLALLAEAQPASVAPPPPPPTTDPSTAWRDSSLPPSPSAPPHTSAAAAAAAAPVVRPSKVRRLLAMRACRSSVMIGRSLTRGQMARLVRHMGTMERPWNCPHGRPTMRHAASLGGWGGWREGDGLWGMRDRTVGEGEDGDEGAVEAHEGEDWGDRGTWVKDDGEVDWEGWLEAPEEAEQEDEEEGGREDADEDAGEEEAADMSDDDTGGDA